MAAGGLTGPRGFGNGGRSGRDEGPATRPRSETSSRQMVLTRCPLCPRDSRRVGDSHLALGWEKQGEPLFTATHSLGCPQALTGCWYLSLLTSCLPSWPGARRRGRKRLPSAPPVPSGSSWKSWDLAKLGGARAGRVPAEPQTERRRRFAGEPGGACPPAGSRLPWGPGGLSPVPRAPSHPRSKPTINPRGPAPFPAPGPFLRWGLGSLRTSAFIPWKRGRPPESLSEGSGA